MDRMKNPFPPKGTINLESGLPGVLPTLPTESLGYVRRLAMDYLSNRIGQAITVTGPYGSGKTHLIGYLMREVNQQFSTLPSDAPRPQQFYVNCKNGAFLSLYQALAGQLRWDLLRVLSASMLMKVANEQANEERRWAEANLPARKSSASKETVSKTEPRPVENAKARAVVLAKLRENPKFVTDYIIQALVVPQRVLGSRSSAVSEITAEAFDDFRKIIFYLDDANLGEDAYNWLTAREGLSNITKERLGVKRVINSPDDALRALRLIVRMFGDAEIPLLVYIDQIDRLLLGLDYASAQDNAERLKSLVEYFSDCGAFLLLCGPDPVWNRFRPDFFTRVGPAVRLGEIPRDRCRSLVKVYLREGQVYQDYEDPSEIVPFTPNAVEEMWKLRSGNARRFIQTCHQAFAGYSSSRSEKKIDEQLIRRIVTDQQSLLDQGKLVQEIRGVLREKNLSFSRDVEYDGFTADFGTNEVGHSHVLVKILDTNFYTDEAASALRLVQQLETIDRSSRDLRTVVVAMGYVSSDVQESLRKVVDLSLIYEGEGFADEFATELEKLFAEERRTVLAADPRIKNEITNEVTASLQKLLAVRDEQIRDLNTRLEAFFRSGSMQEQSGESLERQNEWRIWLRQDQDRWEQRVATLKKDARDEQTRLQESGERLRLNQFLIRTGLSALAGLIIGLGTYFLMEFGGGYFISFSYLHKYGLTGALSFSVGLGSALCMSYVLAYRRYFPLGVGTNEVARFRGDVSQLGLRARAARLSSYSAYRCLMSPNPVIRYFGVQIFLARGEDRVFPQVDWLEVAAEETWHSLYQAYLTMAARSGDPTPFVAHIRILLETNPDDPRLVLALSVLPAREALRISVLENPEGSRINPKLLAHAVFHEVDPRDSWSKLLAGHSHPLVEFAVMYRLPGSSQRMDLLTQRFRDQGVFWKELSGERVRLTLTEDELRLILEGLSPHREFGLASFYQLPLHRFYLRLYRFFAEIEWRAERGDILLAAA